MVWRAQIVAQASAHRRPRTPRAPTRGKVLSAEDKVAEDGRTAAELAQALAALQAQTAELLQRKNQLRQLNRWFDVALNNMGRGLSMFDEQNHLIVCNKIYRKIYGLPERLTRSGTPLAKIMRFHAKNEGKRITADELRRQEKWLSDHVAKLKKGQAFSYTQKLKNGHIVQVTNQPLPGGGWVDIQEDITERRRAEQKITWLAHHDPLTETANRVYFSQELEHALNHLAPGGGFALHWIDLDHFKSVNDTLGHPAGDMLLKSVAKRLIKTVRNHDLVARLGGDEFAVIQPGVSGESQAEELTRRLLAAVNAPHRVFDHEIVIGASIGVVIAPQHGTSAEELMRNVDLALYEVKSAGRRGYAVFRPAWSAEPRDGRGRSGTTLVADT